MTCVERYLSKHYEHLLQMANRYVGEDYGGDLLNDLCVTYLHENDKAEELCKRGELGAYIGRTLQICGFSKTSPFYTKYKKHLDQVTSNTPVEFLKQTEQEGEKNEIEIKNQMNAVFRILQEVRWIDAEIYKAYHLHSHSLNSLSNATGISKNTIYKSVKTAQAYLEENSQRIRRHGGEFDTEESKAGSGGSDGGRLRLQREEELAKQEVPVFPSDERAGPKNLGRGARASDAKECADDGPAGNGD